MCAGCEEKIKQLQYATLNLKEAATLLEELILNHQEPFLVLCEYIEQLQGKYLDARSDYEQHRAIHENSY